MKILPWIIVVVLIVIVAYAFSQKNKTTAVANSAISSIAENNCVPFTQADQDAEKKRKQNECLRKWAVPLVGQGLYLECVRVLKDNLTPVKEC